MSTPLALAAVTALLRIHIQAAVGGEWTPELPRTRVITLPPDHVAVTDETGPLVNVFLCDVQPGAALLRDRPAPGAAAGDAMPVRLSYLVSAHGILPLDADILLGQVLAAVRRVPVLAPADIRHMLDPDSDDPSGSMPRVFRREALTLAETVDHLTITLRPLSLTDCAQLWQGLRTPLRPCVVLDVDGVSL
ncbi:MAG: Pvc16 family protein [Vicinamibacterales bacterium]